MNETSIQWTDYTAQVVRFRSKATGRTLNWCEKVSPGCRGCYAERITRRFHGTAHSYTRAGRELVEPFLDLQALREIASTRRTGRLFVEDMSDLFGGWVTDAWLDECFGAFVKSRLTIQILTKRSNRMRRYIDTHPNLPLPGIWLGVSVENKDELRRIDDLKETQAAVLFVSFEPLLEDLGAVNLDGIHWAIIGGESGPNARPCSVDAVRSLLAQCRRYGVAPFVKQFGRWVLGDHAGFTTNHWLFADGRAFVPPIVGEAARTRPIGAIGFSLCDSHGGDPEEWPEDLRIRQYPA